MESVKLKSNAQTFLQMYRILETELEKRYEGQHSGSVVMRYLSDPDSIPFRTELNTCREIRNLLSHTADETGDPFVEPSGSILDSLAQVIDYVQRPRLAIDCGTPHDKILYVVPNDLLIHSMHRMVKHGFSHAPVMSKNRIVGVLSTASVFNFLERNGLSALNDRSRIADLKDALNFDTEGNHRYLFMPRDTTLAKVRYAFEECLEKNNHLSVVFITPTGSREEPVLAMLTHWDVLKEGTEN